LRVLITSRTVDMRARKRSIIIVVVWCVLVMPIVGSINVMVFNQI
jgi:hypothetical protein